MFSVHLDTLSRLAPVAPASRSSMFLYQDGIGARKSRYLPGLCSAVWFLPVVRLKGQRGPLDRALPQPAASGSRYRPVNRIANTRNTEAEALNREFATKRAGEFFMMRVG